MASKIQYSFNDHLVTVQNEIENRFMTRFEKESPTLDNAHVIANPYTINPLCALILFKTNTETDVHLTIHGKRFERDNLCHTFAKKSNHHIPVIGLYPGMINKVTLRLGTGESKTFNITTDPLPANVSICKYINTSAEYLGEHFVFLSSSGRKAPVAYDYQGNVRWFLTVTPNFDFKRLANGNIIAGSNRFFHMPYNSTGLLEMNLLGKIYKEFRMPGGYHHDQFEMEGGNILALTQDLHSNTVEDMIVLLDRKSGDVLKSWDFKDFLPQDVAGSGSQDAHDWFHNNALWYDKKTNSITISGRHQDAIVNFDYDTSKLNWIIGDSEGWPKEMVEKYFFKPVGDVANFDWQYEQHACLVTPDGDIMCFDNGQYRSKCKEKYIKNKDNFSRGVRYRIDTNKMEIEQVWQYGKERGQSFFSPYICNVEYYAEGHYMIHSGGIAFQNGDAADGLGAFLDASDPSIDVCSKTVEEKDGVVLYELEVSGNFYRAEKLTPYHIGENCILRQGSLLGALDITPTFDTIPELDELDELPSSDRKIRIEEEEDRFLFHGMFEHGTLVMILLDGEHEKRAYYVNTAAVNYLAMCSGTFLEKDDRVIKTSISKNGLKGKYNIKFVINDAIYQSGVTLFC